MMNRARAVLCVAAAIALAVSTAHAGDAPPVQPPVLVRVVASDGTPIEGALVEAFATPTRQTLNGRPTWWLMWPIDEAEAAVRRPAVVSSATSGADGMAAVPNLRSDEWDFVAGKSGWARGIAYRRSIGDGPATRTATIVLAHGRSLDGRVREADGRGAAGATVHASMIVTPESTGNPLVVSTICDAAGSYRFDDLPRDDVSVWVAVAGGTTVVRDVVDLRVASTYDVELAPVTRPVAGQVTDWATDKPIVGARVRARAVSDNRSGNSIVEARTDAEGRYVLEGLRSSHVEALTVERSGYVRGAKFGREAAAPGVVRLRPASRLVGTIRGPKGPVVGAHVVVRPSDYGDASVVREIWESKTDGDGRYAIDRLPPGPATVDVLAVGCLPPWNPPFADASTLDRGGSSRRLVELSAAGETRFDVTMVYGRSMSGRVVDPAGRPVEGARVELPGAPGAVTVTGPDGRFALSGLPPKSFGELSVAKHGFRTSSTATSTDSSPNTWTLAPATRVSGRVVAADGSKPRDLNVWLVPFWGRWTNRDLAPTTSASALPVDAEGRYSAFVPWAGGFFIRAGADEFAETLSEMTVTGETAVVVDLTLDTGCVFAGRVVDATTKASVEGALVRLIDRSCFESGSYNGKPGRPFPSYTAGAVRVVATTDADGRFRVPGLFRRDWEFDFQSAGRAPRRVKWDPSDPRVPTGEVEIRVGDVAEVPAPAVVGTPVGAVATVSGRISRTDGCLVDRRRIRLRHVSGVEHVAWADVADNGNFIARGLLPGAYRVDLAVFAPDTTYAFVDLGVVKSGAKDVVLGGPTAR